MSAAIKLPAAVQAALKALPIEHELLDLSGSQVLIERARDIALAANCEPEDALTLLVADMDSELQRSRQLLGGFAKVARQTLEEESAAKAKAREYLRYLRGNNPDVAFRCPVDGITLCVACARKVWLHDVRAILTEDATSMAATELVTDGDWVCDGCDNRCWAGTVEQTYRESAGRNG